MATVVKWSGVTVSVQSALGAAKTIVSITKASPGVVDTSLASPPAAHGVANGEYVVLDVLGMNQVNQRVFRAASVTTDTLQLEDEDTTAYNTFSTGSLQEITFGITVSTITGLTASGGDFDFIDKTTIHETARSQIPGPSSPLVFSMESIWDPADPGLQALKAAADAQGLRAVHLAWPNGYRYLFNAYVGCSGVPTGSAQDKVITPLVFTAEGRGTWYAD